MTLILLSLYNMILTGGIAAFSFFRADSVPDFSRSLSFTPVALFFGLNTVIGLSSIRKSHHKVPEDRLLISRPRKIPKQKVDTISDTNKREFLKLLGATGISFFLFSLFNRRPQNPFFGSPLGPGGSYPTDTEGNKVGFSEKQPTDGYKISEIDDRAIAFYGFTNKDGGWYIMREDSETGSIRYAKGDTAFTNNWANRERITYDYFNNAF